MFSEIHTIGEIGLNNWGIRDNQGQGGAKREGAKRETEKQEERKDRYQRNLIQMKAEMGGLINSHQAADQVGVSD